MRGLERCEVETCEVVIYGEVLMLSVLMAGL